MIDNKIDRDEGLDDARILAHSLDRGTHRGKIDKQRNAGKILQYHPGDDKRYLFGPLALGPPCRKLSNMLLADLFSFVEIAKDRFKNDAYRDRKP